MRRAGIDRMRGAGYTLIPLKGKIPQTRNWVNTAFNEFPAEVLEKGNYGVVLTAEDLVVDVDPRNFAAGDKPLARLVAAAGTTLNSFTVRTGGGGLHIYFKKPRDVAVAHTLREYPGIEFKSAGRQVVGFGSVHPDTGKVYEVVAGDEIKQAPAGLLALLKITAVPYDEIDDTEIEYHGDAGTQAKYVNWLKDAAPISVEGKQGDHTAFAVACYARDLGLPPALTEELMLAHWNDRCQPPWSSGELKAKVIHAYKYAKGKAGAKNPVSHFSQVDPLEATASKADKKEEIAWVMTKSGEIQKSFYNLLNYLKLPSCGLYKVFGYNEFSGQVEFLRPAPWHKGIMPVNIGVTDADLKLCKGYLSINHSFEAQTAAIEEAITVTAHKHKFHPVREWIQAQEWDGVKRLDTWLQEFAGVEDNRYTRAVSRKVLCAAVARVMKPGCKYDHVLVLEGEQNVGKSMLCAALGGEWTADFPVDPASPDTVAAMQSAWVVELAELGSIFRRAEMNTLKAFITRRVDRVRVAYGRLHQNYPRQSIFIATINPDADHKYLADDTGNRRFWPVKVGDRILFKEVAKWRGQLFAEAAIALKNGEQLYMDTQELERTARAEAAARHAEHPWTERIMTWLEDAESGGRRNFVTARDLYVNAMGGLDKQLSRRDVVAIASVMHAAGWETGLRRVNKHVTRGYIRPGTGTSKKDVLEGLI